MTGASPVEVVVIATDTTITIANIPATVNYNGIIYNVVGIYSYAYHGHELLGFANCSNLISVTIPNSVIYIGDYTFCNCSSLTSVSLDMSSIPANLFPQSTLLQNITLGENVTYIGSGAFSVCPFLQNITCLATTPPTLADNTIFPYPKIATLTVPCGSLEAYSAPTSFWDVFFNGRISESGYDVEVSVNNDAWGSVAVESDCSTATLTATANEGYEFLSWNDGDTDNPRIFNLTSDTVFTAIFAEIEDASLLDAEESELSFYPNPTQGKITFSSMIERIEVIDLSGKVVMNFENKSSINIDALPSGAYYLRLHQNDKAIMRKVIKE